MTCDDWKRWSIGLLGWGCLAMVFGAELGVGDSVKLELRGVEPGEQAKVQGTYRVGESGVVMLPLLESGVRASGLTAEQLARSIERAYRDGGIYERPRVEVTPLTGDLAPEPVSRVSVGGQIRKGGEVEYRAGITVLQAIDAAGGRNEFGGRNILLIRGGKQYVLDFQQLEHKNILLKPNDSLQVEMRGSLLDRWKGEDGALKGLLRVKE